MILSESLDAVNQSERAPYNCHDCKNYQSGNELKPASVEEAENKRTQDGKGRVPVGEDDQCHRDPAVAVDPAAGVEGAGHIQAHVVAADAHDAAAQADVQILGQLHIDAHRIRCAGIFADGAQLQAHGGMIQVKPHAHRNGDEGIGIISVR